MEANPSPFTQLKVYDEDKGIISPSLYDCFFEKFPEFICQICLAFVIDPISCSHCDALFCKKCIYDYTNYSRTCPNRCEINLKPVNRILRNLINQVKVACPFFFKGCSVILNYSNYNKHLTECEYGPFMCNQCNYVNVKPLIVTHVRICKEERRKDFPNAKCSSCGIVILNQEAMITHAYLCPEQMLLCGNCDKKLSLRELRKHQNENSCLVAQLENKIGFLNMKVRFYESQISAGAGGSETGKELCKFSMKEEYDDKDIRKSKSFVSGKNHKKTNDNEDKENIKEETNEKVDHKELEYTNSIIKETKNHISKDSNYLQSIDMTKRNLYPKPSKIKSLLLHQFNQIIYALDNNTIELSTFNSDSSITTTQEISCNEITDKKEVISKMLLFNKQPSLSQEDLFIGTTNGFYFLYTITSSSSHSLLKIGKAVNSSITSLCSLPQNLLAIGTLSSNLIIINPYTNKTIDTLNHSRKEVLSIKFIKDCLITSSTKESSFYIWKAEETKSYELKATIKEHSGWIWTTIEMFIDNDAYLFTGSGDKRIILWRLYPNEETVKNCLVIKGNNDSITCLSLYQIGDMKILISGSYDGVVKINTIENSTNVNEMEIVFTSRCLLSLFNKDDIISSIALLTIRKENDNDKEYCLISIAESNEGFMSTQIAFVFD